MRLKQEYITFITTLIDLNRKSNETCFTLLKTNFATGVTFTQKTIRSIFKHFSIRKRYFDP